VALGKVSRDRPILPGPGLGLFLTLIQTALPLHLAANMVRMNA